MPDPAKILYCRCAYAQVIPNDVKDGVLQRLCENGSTFDSVSDLCEMSARRDGRLKTIAEGGPVKIAACHERAVKWLFHAAGAPLDEGKVEIVNMRKLNADDAAGRLLAEDFQPLSSPP